LNRYEKNGKIKIEYIDNNSELLKKLKIINEIQMKMDAEEAMKEKQEKERTENELKEKEKQGKEKVEKELMEKEKQEKNKK